VADVKEVNDVEKNADLDVEDEADEEISQQDEDAQPIENASEGDEEPQDPEGEDGEDQEWDLNTNEVDLAGLREVFDAEARPGQP